VPRNPFLDLVKYLEELEAGTLRKLVVDSGGDIVVRDTSSSSAAAHVAQKMLDCHGVDVDSATSLLLSYPKEAEPIAVLANEATPHRPDLAVSEVPEIAKWLQITPRELVNP